MSGVVARNLFGTRIVGNDAAALGPVGRPDNRMTDRQAASGDEKQYIIKSALEPCGRVAKESEL